MSSCKLGSAAVEVVRITAGSRLHAYTNAYATAGPRRAFSSGARQHIEMGLLTLVGCGTAFALYGLSFSLCVLFCAWKLYMFVCVYVCVCVCDRVWVDTCSRKVGDKVQEEVRSIVSPVRVFLKWL
jgi:hypothetical protein